MKRVLEPKLDKASALAAVVITRAGRAIDGEPVKGNCYGIRVNGSPDASASDIHASLLAHFPGAAFTWIPAAQPKA